MGGSDILGKLGYELLHRRVSNVEIAIAAILAVLIGLVLGVIGVVVGKRIAGGRRQTAAKSEAEKILEDAGEQRRAMVIEAKEEAIKVRGEAESELRERRSEIQRTERRMSNREENVERRANNLERREKTLTIKEKESEQVEHTLEELRQSELRRLEEVANLPMPEAKDILMRRAEDDIKHELAVQYRNIEEQAKEEANDKARSILALAIHRLAADVVSDVTLTSVPLPNDDMKGRLIGREGRNIRAIEKYTGVDMIIDDTPEAVTLSCFDPIRREVARLAVTTLVADGRIHPARIEEMVAKAEKEVADNVWKCGEAAVFDVGVRGLNPDIIRLLGRLKYRYSYGENVLQHSIEVAHLSGMIASEIGANVKTAKAGGLLHDLGKALTHEVEGPHAEIGADIAQRHSISKAICACIAEHHNDDMSSTEAFIVAAADAISAARPGSRRDTVENYIKRLEALEEVGRGFEGVEKCFAIQAGREVRIMVQPQAVDDATASKMARDVVKKIEETLVYPGQIKVTVIRESRAVEYAR
ncbi:MAG: ribonuclease Y [Chloroflexi bacterium]|nr:ribonuclease Y [Chloroflexota bacterium]